MSSPTSQQRRDGVPEYAVKGPLYDKAGSDPWSGPLASQLSNAIQPRSGGDNKFNLPDLDIPEGTPTGPIFNEGGVDVTGQEPSLGDLFKPHKQEKRDASHPSMAEEHPHPHQAGKDVHPHPHPHPSSHGHVAHPHPSVNGSHPHPHSQPHQNQTAEDSAAIGGQTARKSPKQSSKSQKKAEHEREDAIDDLEDDLKDANENIDDINSDLAKLDRLQQRHDPLDVDDWADEVGDIADDLDRRKVSGSSNIPSLDESLSNLEGQYGSIQSHINALNHFKPPPSSTSSLTQSAQATFIAQKAQQQQQLHRRDEDPEDARESSRPTITIPSKPTAPPRPEVPLAPAVESAPKQKGKKDGAKVASENTPSATDSKAAPAVTIPSFPAIPSVPALPSISGMKQRGHVLKAVRQSTEVSPGSGVSITGEESSADKAKDSHEHDGDDSSNGEQSASAHKQAFSFELQATGEAADKIADAIATLAAQGPEQKRASPQAQIADRRQDREDWWLTAHNEHDGMSALIKPAVRRQFNPHKPQQRPDDWWLTAHNEHDGMSALTKPALEPRNTPTVDQADIATPSPTVAPGTAATFRPDNDRHINTHDGLSGNTAVHLEIDAVVTIICALFLGVACFLAMRRIHRYAATKRTERARLEQQKQLLNHHRNHHHGQFRQRGLNYAAYGDDADGREAAASKLTVMVEMLDDSDDDQVKRP
ncbi:unnamed protein product [Jaminaea pallidilutea]